MVSEEGTKYYLYRNYLTDGEGRWILETAHDDTKRETNTHMYLVVTWGKDQWIEKDKILEINPDIFWMINYFLKEYHLGMYRTLDELNGEIDSYLKDNEINY